MKKRESIKGYVFVAAAAVMWASSGTAGKALFGGGMTPLDLVKFRLASSCLMLAAIFLALQKDLFRIRTRDIGYFFLLGIAIGTAQLTYFSAISMIKVAAATLLQYLAPVLVVLYSVCFWKERLTRHKLLSLLLSLTGLYLVVGGYNLELLRMNVAGVAAGLMSALGFAAYSLMGERGMHRYSPWTVLFYSFLFSCLASHAASPHLEYLRGGPHTAHWALMGYVAVMGTLIPFGLYLLGVNYLRSTDATITGTLEPISAALIAYLFLGETLEPLQMVGGGLVIAAVVALQFQRERDPNAPHLIRAHTRNGTATRAGERRSPPAVPPPYDSGIHDAPSRSRSCTLDSDTGTDHP